MKIPNLHKRLKKIWPEEPEQLHLGGWNATYELMDEISSYVSGKKNVKIMDICCGEGTTAIYMSRLKKWSIFGIDIVESVIKLAKMKSIIDNTYLYNTFLCYISYTISFIQYFFIQYYTTRLCNFM